MQCNILYKDLAKAGVSQVSAAEEHSESRLLEDCRITKALLNFLTVTDVEGFGDENARMAVRAQ